MKLTRSIGLMTLSLSLLITSFASNSAESDLEAGLAANVVSSGNVIQVYTYTGASSEAGMMSTFNEGENWLNMPTTSSANRVNSMTLQPEPKTLYSRVNRSTAVTVESDYIKKIDACTETGKRWNFRDDTCIENY